MRHTMMPSTRRLRTPTTSEITVEQLQTLVGHEEAANVRVLKTQLNEAFLDDAAEEFADS